MNKFKLYGERARELYLAGKSFSAIEKLIPVSERTIREWRTAHGWDDELEKAPVHAYDAVTIMKQRLQGKISGLADNMTAADVDEIAKITAIIQRMEKGGSELYGMVLEVMDRYLQYLKKVLGPKEFETQTQIVRGFFEYIAEQA